MDQKTINARLKGEAVRTMENIAARTERPKKMWWLSFAGENGFHGACIVHANDFMEAVMDANIHECNPGGEVRGLEIPIGTDIEESWKYRTLSRADCKLFDKERGF